MTNADRLTPQESAKLIAEARWHADVAVHMPEDSGEHMSATCGTCAAREDIPRLANALEAAEAQVAELKAQLEKLNAQDH